MTRRSDEETDSSQDRRGTWVGVCNTRGVSPHLIVRLPGKGGMAEVYEVENAWPGRESAIL